MNPQAWPNNLSLSVIGSPGHGDEEWRSGDGWTGGGASESEGAKRRPSARRERAPSTLQGKSISQRFGFGTEGKVENDAVKPSERSKGVQWDEMQGRTIPRLGFGTNYGKVWQRVPRFGSGTKRQGRARACGIQFKDSVQGEGLCEALRSTAVGPTPGFGTNRAAGRLEICSAEGKPKAQRQNG